jgi:hypothetical protein
MHKKGKISGLEFWSSGVECINLKNNHLLERGKLWKSI